MSLTIRALFWFLIASVTTSLVFEGWRRRIADQLPASDDPGDLSSPVTFRRAHAGVEYRTLDSVRIPWNGDEKPGVSVIILNWSSFQNVVLIASELCDPRLQGVIAEIVVWNNSPQQISAEVSGGTERFATSNSTRSHHPPDLTVMDLRSSPPVTCAFRLRIVNSPENLYFQARFMACSNSTSKHCFIQVCRAYFSPSVNGGGS